MEVKTALDIFIEKYEDTKNFQKKLFDTVNTVRSTCTDHNNTIMVLNMGNDFIKRIDEAIAMIPAAYEVVSISTDGKLVKSFEEACIYFKELRTRILIATKMLDAMAKQYEKEEE